MKFAAVAAIVVGANVVAWAPMVWLAGNPLDTTAVPIDQSGRGAGVDVAAQDDLELDFSELTPVHSYSRPLFSRTRKPWQPATRAPEQQVQQRPQAAPQQPPPAVKLVGVSMSGNAVSRALLRHEVEIEPIWVLEGDELDGWMVARIDMHSIELRQGDRTISIDLYPEGRAVR